MKASELSLRRRFTAWLCPVLVFAGALYFCDFQYSYGTQSNGDKWGYMEAIAEGRHRGWWAPVTLWECHQIYVFLNALAEKCIGMPFCDMLKSSPHRVLMLVYKCHIFLFAFSIALLAYNRIKHKSWNGVCVCFLCGIAFYMARCCAIGHRLDFFFVADILFLLLLADYAPHLSRRLKWLAFVIFLIVLFHVADIRKNALLLVPLFLFAWHQRISPGSRFRHKVLFTVLLSVVFVGLKSIAERSVINTKILSSTHVMLLSDLRMASILGNRYEEYVHRDRSPLPKPGWVHCPAGQLVPGSTESTYRKQHGQLAALSISELEEGEDIYVHNVKGDIGMVMNEYWQALRNHPRDMLLARLITIDQFFWGTNTAEWKRRWVGMACPAVQGHPELWREEQLDSRWKGESLDALRCTTLLMYALTAATLLLCISKKRKELLQADESVQQAFLAVLVGSVYLLSFLPVTPTPDFRYHYAPLLLFCYGTPILWVSLLKAKNRVAAQEPSPREASAKDARGEQPGTTP